MELNVTNSLHNSAVSFQRLVRHECVDSEIHADIVRRRERWERKGWEQKGGKRKGWMEGERDRGC